MSRCLELAFSATLLASPLAAQQPLSRDEAMIYTAPAIEGFPPEAVVQRVIADSSTLIYYDDILNGREPWPEVGDTATVLFFLQRSGQGRFLTTFLRYAADPADMRHLSDWSAATAGLIALADSVEARNRLIQIAGKSESRMCRLTLAGMLEARNSVAAREILKMVDTTDFPPPELARLRAVLATPAKP